MRIELFRSISGEGWLPLVPNDASPETIEIMLGLPFLLALSIPPELYQVPAEVPLSAGQKRQVDEIFAEITKDCFADDPKISLEILLSDTVLDGEAEADLLEKWRIRYTEYEQIYGHPMAGKAS